ncbi:MAG TPA: response regulator [Nitrososphaeraceae archaeon]|nr:response regulator [Nitrososphaeraceae archaeon]
MNKKMKESLRILIVEDEQDILTLYCDYLKNKGYKNISKYLSADGIMEDIKTKFADIYILDYRLPGKNNGIEIAIEILNEWPSASILFITAYNSINLEILTHSSFKAKKVSVLVKPVKLLEIEHSIVRMLS